MPARRLRFSIAVALRVVCSSIPVLIAGVVPIAARAADTLPNIVVLLCDDLGYGDVQNLNPERGKIATPHFDRLAADGMTFTDAHSGS
jgi:hypothetical protein